MRLDTLLLLLGLLHARVGGTTVEVLRPRGGDPAPSPNPPIVDLIAGAVVDESALVVTLDGLTAARIPEADGIDNDLDGMVDEPGEREASWPDGSTTRFVIRWPYAVSADDPATAENEGIHLLHLRLCLPTGPWEQDIRFMVGTQGGVDSLVAWPSPFDPHEEGLRVGYRVRSAGLVRVRVHDFQGRVVRTLCEWAPCEAGWHRQAAVWDGRDEAGRKVGNGPYYVKVEFDNGSWIEDTVVPCLVAH